MARYYQGLTSIPGFCTSQYSTLHQERLYLLQSLAEEEERGERLTKSLESLKAKLENHDPADTQVSARKLKTAIKSIRHKIGRCQYRERALSANLSNVVGQMEGAKRYQWRSAHQEYSYQSHFGQMMTMSPAAPSFALQSPLPAALTAQMQYMALSTPRHHVPPWTYGAYSIGAAPRQTQVFNSATMDDGSWLTSSVGQWTGDQSRLDTLPYSPVSSISSVDLVPSSSHLEERVVDAISPLPQTQQRPWSWPGTADADADTNGQSESEA